ncbi:MAG TPA: multicopper oxidase domain-containing protein [Candidatus Eremiobacteraceae bacterium]
MRRPASLALAVLASLAAFHQPAIARERVHFIAADDVLWNYAPQTRDVISGNPLRPEAAAQLGWTYHKAVYRAYTDATFASLAPIPPSERYRGLVGPTIHAEVGDTVVVVFRNRTQVPVDIAPSGVASIPKPAAVMPGSTRTFRWPVTAADGPGAADGSSVLFAYSSDVQQTPDENAGLIGPLVITRKGSARADGSPADVDREITTLFSSQAEPRSALVQENVRDRAINPKGIAPASKTFFVDNVFPSINGYVYGNMPLPQMRAHDRVRWYLLSTMNDIDGHAPTWDGQTVLYQGNRSDSIGLVTMHVLVDMVPDDPGIWLLKCSFNIHLAAGMEARYEVEPRESKAPAAKE